MSATEWIRHEIREVGAATLYFLIGLVLILVLFKLLLNQYDIQLVALSKAVIGALICAKVVVLLKNRRIMRVFSDRPGYVTVLYKTIVYDVGLVVILLLEKTIERYGEAGSVGAALKQVFETRDIHHVLAVALMASMMFLFFNAMGELSSRLGEDKVRAAFFGKMT